eukprot:CAMPEP_0173077980 /NCGR_PEP_ID=MMETSP1102-20130122/13720_1 /TAXON_ID=49646 /ORGANISM="Geminigera sp., Strain Caron Lab Isolate" /LENGTH=309 /DNA_ID=CAMNT_0013948913 /DNA_START=274 /DNA_END=1204 /DNA_ORIENTATION=+
MARIECARVLLGLGLVVALARSSAAFYVTPILARSSAAFYVTPMSLSPHASAHTHTSPCPLSSTCSRSITSFHAVSSFSHTMGGKGERRQRSSLDRTRLRMSQGNVITPSPVRLQYWGGAVSAILGGGCFWCTEAIFLEAAGVLTVTPGYAGGGAPNPTYKQVVTGKTGHAEVIRVEFDPKIISLQQVYDLHLSTHDITQVNRQGADVGTQYRSTILVSSALQRDSATRAIDKAQENLKGEKFLGFFGGNAKVATRIEEAQEFYPAENYHKDYYAKNPMEPYCMRVITPKMQSFKVRDSLRQLRQDTTE